MNKIGVVGAGTMGQGIATAFAASGYQVTVCDIKIEWAQSGIDKIAASYDKLASKGKVTADFVASVKSHLKTGEYKDLADCDVVIEAILETSCLQSWMEFVKNQRSLQQILLLYP